MTNKKSKYESLMRIITIGIIVLLVFLVIFNWLGAYRPVQITCDEKQRLDFFGYTTNIDYLLNNKKLYNYAIIKYENRSITTTSYVWAEYGEDCVLW